MAVEKKTVAFTAEQLKLMLSKIDDSALSEVEKQAIGAMKAETELAIQSQNAAIAKEKAENAIVANFTAMRKTLEAIEIPVSVDVVTVSLVLNNDKKMTLDSNNIIKTTYSEKMSSQVKGAYTTTLDLIASVNNYLKPKKDRKDAIASFVHDTFGAGVDNPEKLWNGCLAKRQWIKESLVSITESFATDKLTVLTNDCVIVDESGSAQIVYNSAAISEDKQAHWSLVNVTLGKAVKAKKAGGGRSGTFKIDVDGNSYTSTKEYILAVFGASGKHENTDLIALIAKHTDAEGVLASSAINWTQKALQLEKSLPTIEQHFTNHKAE